MSDPIPFFPQAVFGDDPLDPSRTARVLITPHRYIQGQGALDDLGKYMSLVPSVKPVVLITAGGEKRFGNQIQNSLAKSGIRHQVIVFDGECSHSEVNRLVALVKQKAPDADALVAVGGGKCLDAGKSTAYRLGLPVAICPTIASTDAPCSAVSVMYSEEGVQVGPEFFTSNPSLVIVDTRIIINAPIRQLVAGMGDALATYYEARTCYQNPKARSMVGARPTIAALAIAELCARTILEQGLAAVEAVQRKEINDAFEQIVEANTLLSGVGFESGGLAAAHAIAAGLTVIPALHRDYFHGELVAIGLLAHLLLESKDEEAERVGAFMAKVGLPVHTGQLALQMDRDAAGIMAAMENAVGSHLTDAEPFAVTPRTLHSAFGQANQLGLRLSGEIGDAAYRRLHP